jgi:hypothetical protein
MNRLVSNAVPAHVARQWRRQAAALNALYEFENINPPNDALAIALVGDALHASRKRP